MHDPESRVTDRGPVTRIPVFDPSALEALRAATPACSGLVERVAQAWLRDAPARITQAREAAVAGRAEDAHRAVHSLKSASATVGAMRLAASCREAEQAYKTGALDPALLDEVERDYADVVGEVMSIPELGG